MKQKFIKCETLEEAQEKAPWAIEFLAYKNGFMAFESLLDSHVWMDKQNYKFMKSRGFYSV